MTMTMTTQEMMAIIEKDPLNISNIDNPPEEVQIAAVKLSTWALGSIKNPCENVIIAALQAWVFSITYMHECDIPIETALKANIDINEQNPDGDTPLHDLVGIFKGDACSDTDEAFIHSRVSLFLELGMNCGIKNNEGDTVLDITKKNKLDGAVSLIEAHIALKEEASSEAREASVFDALSR